MAYTLSRLERLPRGRSCFAWHSALSPTARGQRPERVIPHEGNCARSDFYKIWWRRLRGTIPQVPEGTAHYKCAPLPVRVNPPLSKSRCASKASVKLEAGTGIEPAWQPLQRMRLAIRTTPPSSATRLWSSQMSLKSTIRCSLVTENLWKSTD